LRISFSGKKTEKPDVGRELPDIVLEHQKLLSGSISRDTEVKYFDPAAMFIGMLQVKK